jgi:hypothetical protein
MAERVECSCRSERRCASAAALRIARFSPRDLTRRQRRAHVRLVTRLAARLPTARRPRWPALALVRGVRRWWPAGVRRVAPQLLLQLGNPRLELLDASLLLLDMLEAPEQRLASRAVGVRERVDHQPYPSVHFRTLIPAECCKPCSSQADQRGLIPASSPAFSSYRPVNGYVRHAAHGKVFVELRDPLRSRPPASGGRLYRRRRIHRHARPTSVATQKRPVVAT